MTSVFFSKVTNKDALEVLNIFRSQAWKYFLNHQPKHYIDEQVVEFYTSLRHDEELDELLATVTLETHEHNANTVYHRFDIDVVRIVRRLFSLPYKGDLLYTKINPIFVEGIMRRMMEEDSPSTLMLKRALFLPKYKLMINILNRCYFGQLGSFDQVLANQKMMLASLTYDKEINWESPSSPTCKQTSGKIRSSWREYGLHHLRV